MKHEDVLKRLRQDSEYVAAEEELKPVLEIANTVLRLRLVKGWSQSELARRAGTKQANISKLENGLANPTLDFLRRVAKALEVDFNIHFGSEKPAETPQIVYVMREIRTVKPEMLWGSQRAHSVATQQWTGFATISKSGAPDAQFQAA